MAVARLLRNAGMEVIYLDQLLRLLRQRRLRIPAAIRALVKDARGS